MDKNCFLPMKPYFLFSGTSNPDLSSAIADRLNHPLDKIEITRFIDNECRVRVNEEVDGHPIFVIQSLSQIADQHLVETLYPAYYTVDWV